MVNHPTHIAYADESYSTASRYRSVAVVTLQTARSEQITLTFQELLDESDLSEFKWAKLRQARERFAALAIIDKTMDLTTKGWMVTVQSLGTLLKRPTKSSKSNV